MGLERGRRIAPRLASVHGGVSSLGGVIMGVGERKLSRLMRIDGMVLVAMCSISKRSR